VWRSRRGSFRFARGSLRRKLGFPDPAPSCSRTSYVSPSTKPDTTSSTRTHRQTSSCLRLVAAPSYAAALFFVIVLGHTALREGIAAVKITYLEYLYVLLYALLLLVVIDAFLVVRRPGAVLIHYRNNLIPKLLYWPVAAVALLLATLGTFVYGPAP
jgi:hypothetical protein